MSEHPRKSGGPDPESGQLADICVVIDAMPAMAWATSADGGRRYLNDRTLQFLGIPRAESYRYGCQDLVHPADANRILEARAGFASAREFQADYRLRHAGGEFRWVSDAARPVHDADGRLIAWIGALTDVQDLVDSRRRQAEVTADLRSRSGLPAPSTALGALAGEQIRAARALCRMEQAELAREAGVSLETIKRLEGFRGPAEATTRTIATLVQAFERAGVVFDLQAGTGPGLRFVSPTPGRKSGH